MTLAKLESVLTAIDQINANDPNQELVEQKSVAKELIYGQRMSDCLLKHYPDADEYLQIAVRGQHIARWKLARSEYPEGKQGYFAWRKALGIFHAETVANVMLENGYSEAEASETAKIIKKEQLRNNQNSQTLEDVACLVFLQYYFDAFAAKHSDEKIISIVQKTWKKMSVQGQEFALNLPLSTQSLVLINKALA
jgi:5-methylthioribose kinase